MDNYDEGTIIIFVIIGVLALFNILRLRHHTKSLRNYKNIPPLEVPLEGMYVKMKGIIASKNTLQTPIGRDNVVFYQFKALATYTVKAISPGKGVEVVEKNLHTEYSKEKILIDKKNNIFIEITNKHNLMMMIHQKTLSYPTALPQYPEHSRATKFIYEEQYLKEGDAIVVSGRLTKKDDYYLITHTHSERLPLIIQLNNDKFIIDKYLHKRKINFAFIMLASVIYFYIR